MARLGGIDLGATNLRAAIADGPGEPIAVERRPTPNDADGEAVARAAADCLATAASTAGIRVEDLQRVGVGTVGPLDRDAGAVVRPPNLASVQRIPVRTTLIELVGHERVYVENDAIAGLVGERVATADPPANLVYLTLSTGIGAGVTVDGHILRGRGGNAGEIGHLVVDPRGKRTCGCGRPGHWEAYAGGRAIPDLARGIARETAFETGLDLDDSGLSAADIFGGIGGDGLADQVVERITRYNAVGVANLVHAFSPDRIAIGGAVALENPAVVIEPLPEALAEYAMLPIPKIRPAAHGREAVLRGALSLAVEEGLGG